MTRPTWSTKWRFISSGVRNVREGKVSKGHTCMRFTSAPATAAQQQWEERYRRTEIFDFVLRHIERSGRREHAVRSAPDIIF